MSQDYLASVNLLDLPCYIINLTRNTARWNSAYSRATAAGFKNIVRFPAIDGRTRYRLRLSLEWKKFPPKFLHNAPRYFKLGRGMQGCYLSHMSVWRHISDQGIPAAIVFEDDIIFHENWQELWPQYWEQTPKNLDVLYMGSDIEFEPSSKVERQAVWCNHAILFTCAGATKMYDYVKSQPPDSIDFVTLRWQRELLKRGLHDVLNWYVWTARTSLPLVGVDKLRHVGLVFQDRSFPSENDWGTPAT